MVDDERQLVPREPEPRRVEATADDVIGPDDAKVRYSRQDYRDAIHKRMVDNLNRAEEELLYGYVGGQAAYERQQEEARRQRPKRIIDRAIEDVSRLPNLRTPEADAPDREDQPWIKGAIRQSVEQVKDPALKRALLEELHRAG